MRTRQRREAREFVAQRDEIVGRDIIGIGGMNLGDEGPAFIVTAESQEILSELNAGGLIVGVWSARR
jgi:hypothetical protein